MTKLTARDRALEAAKKLPIPLMAWLGCKDDCPIAFIHKIHDWIFTLAVGLLVLACVIAFGSMVFR